MTLLVSILIILATCHALGVRLCRVAAYGDEQLEEGWSTESGAATHAGSRDAAGYGANPLPACWPPSSSGPFDWDEEDVLAFMSEVERWGK